MGIGCLIARASLVFPLRSGRTRRAGGKDPGHDRKPFDSLDAIAPAANCRVILPGDPTLFGQHDVGEARDVGDCRMLPRADPITPFLLAEPEVFVEDAKQPVRPGSSRLDVKIVE